MTSDKSFDYSGYDDAPNTEDVLGELADLAAQQKKYEDEITKLGEQLKKLNSLHKEIAEQSIPDLMEQVGMESFTTNSGISLKITTKIRTSISKPNHAEAMQWLIDNGHGGLIKSTVTASFPCGQERESTALYEYVNSNFTGGVSQNQKVEPSTLTAFVKKQLEAGHDIPFKPFGVYRQRIAEIKG